LERREPPKRDVLGQRQMVYHGVGWAKGIDDLFLETERACQRDPQRSSTVMWLEKLTHLTTSSGDPVKNDLDDLDSRGHSRSFYWVEKMCCFLPALASRSREVWVLR
jgi:hypothetical protein